jgi:hypothetical protein
MSDKIKTLGQAIRYGATLKPQWRGAMIHDGKTCALGAALDALGLLKGAVDAESQLVQRFQIDKSKRFLYPKRSLHSFGQCGTLFEVIVRLNDQYEWSREKISYWVDYVLTKEKKVVVL